MQVEEITVYYTYRSFLNRSEPVDDFNRIRFAEAELCLFVQVDGTVSGTLAFPATPAADEKAIMDLTGSVTSWSPFELRWTGRGRPMTEIADFVYEYDAKAAHHWEQGVNQRLALVGTVLRVQDHGSGDNVARAGATASFVAVRRDFLEPRDVPGLALIPEALTMLAGRLHRLRHTVWHTVRGVWWDPLDDTDRAEITKRGWGFARPPFNQEGVLDLTNGAGEDFLFMHRRMIGMVRDAYSSAGLPPIQSWASIPDPGTPQFVYAEQNDPENPDRTLYRFAPDQSGFMVPPGEPAFLDFFDPSVQPTLRFLKSPAHFRTVMGPLQRLFRSRTYLSALWLGALGNLIEFTIHNQMHMRWATIPRDPETGVPALRDDFDTGEKWTRPDYDWLGDFYSSHVNPLFWRLHGWVDDRIEDWYQAHEATHPGEVERFEYKGASWFKPGTWVLAADPFDWPGDSHAQEHDHDDDGAIAIMLEVLDIVRNAVQRMAPAAVGLTRARLLNVTKFMRWIEP